MKTLRQYTISNSLQFVAILILIPLFLIIKISSDSKQYCIDITFIPVNDSNYISKLLAKRDYSIIHYRNSDHKILKNIERFAYDIEINSNDSIGIKVVIKNNIKYETFIELLNTCIKSGISDWLPYGDSLFVFHRDQKISLAPDAPLFELEEDFYNEKWYKKFTHSFEKIALFSLLYLIILYVSYRQIKNNECTVDNSFNERNETKNIDFR